MHFFSKHTFSVTLKENSNMSKTCWRISEEDENPNIRNPSVWHMYIANRTSKRAHWKVLHFGLKNGLALYPLSSTAIYFLWNSEGSSMQNIMFYGKFVESLFSAVQFWFVGKFYDNFTSVPLDGWHPWSFSNVSCVIYQSNFLRSVAAMEYSTVGLTNRKVEISNINVTQRFHDWKYSPKSHDLVLVFVWDVLRTLRQLEKGFFQTFSPTEVEETFKNLHVIIELI